MKTDQSINTICAECGSPNVSYAIWYHPNTGATGDVFGSWCAGDNSFCDDCDDCTDLISRDSNPGNDTFARKLAEYRAKERR